LDFEPIKSWGSAENTYGTPSSGASLDFILEGVPSLTANRRPSSVPEIDLETLKKNTAVAGILAFGLAEQATPLGPRLLRAEIEQLLNRTGLKARMHSIFVETSLTTGTSKSPSIPKIDLWHLWETGQRGRQP